MAEFDSNFTNLVASGNLTVSGLATLGTAALGGATSGGKPTAGLTDPTANVSGTTQNTEYALNTVTLPANAFNANGRGVTVYAWGTLAANANAKDYFIVLNVLRTGASTQSAVAQVWIDTGTAPTLAVTTSLAEVDTAAIAVTVKSANTAAAAASATGKGLVTLFTN